MAGKGNSRRFGAAAWLALWVAVPAAGHGADRNGAIADIGPVRVITIEQLRATGHTRLNEALATLLPSFTFARPSAAGATDHMQPGTLRGLAPDHTLVLVDGKRRHRGAAYHVGPTIGRGSVGTDLDALPLAAIQRVEVLGVGAVAHYGSDAVAGVINLVLADADHGGSLSGTFSQYRTHLDGVPRFEGAIPDNATGTIHILSAGQRAVDDGDGDVVTLSGDWGTTLFDDGFMHFSADYREQDPTNRSGIDPRQQYPLQDNGDFQILEATVDRVNHRYGNAAVEDLNLLFNAALPLTDRLELYGFTGYSLRDGESAGRWRRPIDDDNLLAVHPHGFLPLLTSDIDDRSFVLGLRGRNHGWDWDFSYNQGENEIDWGLDNSLNPSMGPGSPTSFAIGNTESRQQSIRFDLTRPFDVEALAGPLTLRIGVEQRSEEYEVEAGELAAYLDGGFLAADGTRLASGAQGALGFRPPSAAVRAELGTGDIDQDRDLYGAHVTLDAAVTPTLQLTAAARAEDYSDVGNVFATQLAARWTASDQWALRAGLGTGYRAPSLAQAHYVATDIVLSDGAAAEAGLFPVESPAAVALGGEALDEEQTLQMSLGVVYQPLADASLSLDLYRIDIDDRVVLADPLGGPAVAAILEDAGVTAVESVQFAINGLDTRTQGLDFTARYGLDLRERGRIAVDLRLNVTDTEITGTTAAPAELAPLGADLDRLGRRERQRITDGTPDSKLILAADWSYGPLTARLTGTRYGEVTDPGDEAADDLTMDAAWLIDLDVRYQANATVQLGFGVKNLGNEYPDVRPTGPGAPIEHQLLPYSPMAPYGFNGRLMYGRVSAAF